MPINTQSFYFPQVGDKTSQDDIWRWFTNIPKELLTLPLEADEREKLKGYYREAGLLTGWRQPFFRHHYAQPFSSALSFLLKSGRKLPLILDLGCGMGTQSLAFAIFGAKVIALDMDTTALAILERRKEFYEQQIGRKLNIKTYNCNVFDFDYELIAPIDGLYSLFAFNMMQPSTDLLSKITRYMSADARIFIQDGNQLCWLPKLFPSSRRNVLTPKELEKELKSHGFSIIDHHGGCVFPPLLWRVFPFSLLSEFDNWIGRKSWLFPVSHLIMVAHK